MDAAESVTVSDEADHSMYVATVAGDRAGRAEYTLHDGVITFTHTIVEPEFEGKGVGGALVRHALDDVRARGGLKVVPECSFVHSYIERHPEYLDLVYGRTEPVSD